MDILIKYIVLSFEATAHTLIIGENFEEAEIFKNISKGVTNLPVFCLVGFSLKSLWRG